MRIATPRLLLVAFDADLAPLPPARLAQRLGARLPPDAVDEDLWAQAADRLLADPSETGWHFWFLLERGAVVGTAGFKGPPDAAGEVEIGYGLVAPARGRGLATEAVGAILGWAFADPRMHRIVAQVERDNAASRGVLAKLGFVPAGPDGTILRMERSRSGK